jgi:hypothetical protein
MKNKIFSLFGLAILTLLVLTSFASAQIAFGNNADTTFSQTTGDILSIAFTGVTGVNTVVPTYSTVADSTGKTITFSPVSPTTVTSPFNITSAITSGFNFEMKQYSTILTLTEMNGTTIVDTPITQTLTFTQTAFCSWDGNNATNLNDDLEVSIKNINVVSGYGEDKEWYPEDEVEVEVKVKNTNNNDHIRNIVLEWGLFDKKTGKWAMEVTDENDFSLKDGEDKTLTLKFKLDNLDENFDELDGTNLVFYARARGDVDADTEYTACASDLEEGISLTIESDFVILNDIRLPETNNCGSQVQITGDVWNIGDNNQNNVYIVVYNKDLGINEKVTIGDIDAFDDGKLDILVKVPQNVEEKTYTLALWVYNEDDEVYQNGNDDESKADVLLKVEGSCSNLPLASVAANLQSETKAGQDLIVKATVANTGSVQKTFGIELTGYEDWATLVSVDKTTLDLKSKATGDVLVTLKVNKDASGEKTFNVLVKDGVKILSQPVTATFEKSSILSALTGLVSGTGDNLYLWGIGALNLVLVLVIIFVAIKVVKGKKK